MPYSSVDDLPPSFKFLPEGAKRVVFTTMNAILDGKAETKELVTAAIRAAWNNIKHTYTKVGDKWVAKSATLVVAPEGLAEVHAVLKEELDRRGLPHLTPWLTEKLAASPTLGQVHIGRNVVGGDAAAGKLVCPECGMRTDAAECPECGVATELASTVAKAAWHKTIKSSDEERMVWGVVYAADDEAVNAWVAKGSPADQKPSTVDTQNDWILESNLRKSYREFMRTLDRVSRSGDPRPFGVGHQVVNPNMTLLQSALLVKGTHWPEPDSEPLDAALNWVQALHVADDSTWESVKRGELTGFSLEGLAEK
jgi:cation transport regulator ChaB